MYRTSIGLESYYTVANTYCEAIMQQCPDIEEMIVALCRAFATTAVCNDEHGVMHLFHACMTNAIEHQKKKEVKHSIALLILKKRGINNLFKD